MPVTFDDIATLPEDLPDLNGETETKTASKRRAKKQAADVKAKPKTEMAVAPPPQGARVDYGGRPAWVGACVWYCLEDEFEPGTLRVMPATLMSRNYTDPSLWEIVIYHPDASSFPADAVPFSEAPKEGYWCWPVIPAE